MHIHIHTYMTLYVVCVYCMCMYVYMFVHLLQLSGGGQSTTRGVGFSSNTLVLVVRHRLSGLLGFPLLSHPTGPCLWVLLLFLVSLFEIYVKT